MTRAYRAVAVIAVLVLITATIPLLTDEIRVGIPEPEVQVEGAFVDVGPSTDTATVYFTLRTNNDPTKLVTLGTPLAQTAELRVWRPDGSRTLRVGETTFSPDAPLVFAPSGKYAFLNGLEPEVRSAETIPITFYVDPAEPLTVSVEVRTSN